MPLLQTTTAEGALKGMVLARAPHELGDQEAAYLQDCIINQPGFVNRRGAITGATALGNNLDSSPKPAGICSTYDPIGQFRLMVLYWRKPAATWELWGAIYDQSITFLQKHLIISFTGGTSKSTVPPCVVTAQGIDGSVVITASDGYGKTATSSSVRWWGASPTASNNYTTAGAGTYNMIFNSTSLSGSVADIALLSPGTVLFNVGIVKQILTTTTALLMSPYPVNGGVIAAIPSVVDGIGVLRNRGQISLVAAGNSITGYGTRFRSIGQDSNTPTTKSTYVFIDPVDGKGFAQTLSTLGVYATVSSDTAMTTDPAFTTLSKSLANYLVYNPQTLGGGYFSFPAVTKTLPWMTQKGFLVASFKGYQIYFNSPESTVTTGVNTARGATARAHLAGPDRADVFDHTAEDGNYFDVTSAVLNDPDGMACMGAANVAVFCKSREAFGLTGDDPDNFALAKIADDGALTCNAITRYQGGVIWLGHDGIWFYDGTAPPVNLVANTMGARWQSLVAAFNGSADADDPSGAWPLNSAHCFVHKDHLFVNINNTGSQFSVYTDGVARTQNSMQLCIYLPNNALSFLTNFNFVGYIPGWPGNSSQGGGYTILAQAGSTAHYLFPIDNLFTQGAASVDAILTTGVYSSGSVSTSVGPWFHMESRKFDGGDGLWKKSWKQLAIEFNESSTKRMFLETVAGLNTVGVRAALPYTGTGAFLAARVKFRTRDQYMGFRLYEDIANRPTSLVLGAWQWGYKFARRGAV